MKKSLINKYNENGAILPIVLIVIMILGLAILTYILLNADKKPREILTIAQYENTATFSKSETNIDFDDGLKNPSVERTFPLDEIGGGLATNEVFNVDINNDGNTDKITRDRYENGTAHFYFEYKIELNLDGQFLNITPENFKTVEGGEVSLQKIRFKFSPQFEIIKIYRPWQDSWGTPTIATKYIYKLRDNKLVITNSLRTNKTDDVSKLF